MRNLVKHEVIKGCFSRFRQLKIQWSSSKYETELPHTKLKRNSPSTKVIETIWYSFVIMRHYLTKCLILRDTTIFNRRWSKAVPLFHLYVLYERFICSSYEYRLLLSIVFVITSGVRQSDWNHQVFFYYCTTLSALFQIQWSLREGKTKLLPFFFTQTNFVLFETPALFQRRIFALFEAVNIISRTKLCFIWNN